MGIIFQRIKNFKYRKSPSEQRGKWTTLRKTVHWLTLEARQTKNSATAQRRMIRPGAPIQAQRASPRAQSRRTPRSRPPKRVPEPSPPSPTHRYHSCPHHHREGRPRHPARGASTPRRVSKLTRWLFTWRPFPKPAPSTT